MTAFDPIKAQRERVQMVHELHRDATARARHKERELAEVEADFNVATKLAAFCTDLIEHETRQLRLLEEAAEQKVM